MPPARSCLPVPVQSPHPWWDLSLQASPGGVEGAPESMRFPRAASPLLLPRLTDPERPPGPGGPSPSEQGQVSVRMAGGEERPSGWEGFFYL